MPRVSRAAQRKVSKQHVDAGDGVIHPVHSFRTLLGDLATLTRNTVCFAGQKTLTIQTTETPSAAPGVQPAGGPISRPRRQLAIGVWSCINGLRSSPLGASRSRAREPCHYKPVGTRAAQR